MIVVFEAILTVCGGCGASDESVSFERVEATQYTRVDLVELVRRTPVSRLLPAITTVNRRDHPCLGELLLGELRASLQEGEGERAAALVQALGWCGWSVVDQVRELAGEFADLDRAHRLAATELFRLMGDEEGARALRRLTEDDDQEVAGDARQVSLDLFGTIEPSPQQEELVPGNTPWIMRCAAGLRTFALTDAECRQRYKLRRALSECPSPRRLDMYRILVWSCTLPLEEFPGHVEMESLRRRRFPRERLGHSGQDHVFSMIRNYPRHIRELSTALVNVSTPEERTAFWRLLADPLAGGDHQSQALYDEWIDIATPRSTSCRRSLGAPSG